jgi:hypothetical protein
LNDAVRVAVEIEAFCRAEHQRRHDIGYARTAHGDLTNKPSEADIKVREEMKQLRDELRSSFRDLENKIATFVEQKDHSGI